LLQKQLYIGIYSVGEVEKQIPDYRIISDDLFDTATEVRTRFRSKGEKRGTMPIDRKKNRVRQICDQYRAWLK
jgi:site-specific DNA recombinase